MITSIKRLTLRISGGKENNKTKKKKNEDSKVNEKCGMIIMNVNIIEG